MCVCGLETERVQDYAMVVPFHEQLQTILSNEDLVSIIKEHHATRAKRRSANDGLISEYYDGQFYKSEPFLTKHADCLVVDLYYDDVTVTDALSSYEAKVLASCLT